MVNCATCDEGSSVGQRLGVTRSVLFPGMTEDSALTVNLCQDFLSVHQIISAFLYSSCCKHFKAPSDKLVIYVRQQAISDDSERCTFCQSVSNTKQITSFSHYPSNHAHLSHAPSKICLHTKQNTMTGNQIPQRTV